MTRAHVLMQFAEVCCRIQRCVLPTDLNMSLEEQTLFEKFSVADKSKFMSGGDNGDGKSMQFCYR